MTVYQIVRYSPLTGRVPVVEFTDKARAEKRVADYQASSKRMESLDRYELEPYDDDAKNYELRRVFYNCSTMDTQSFGINEHAKPAEGYKPAGFGIYNRIGGELRWVEDIADYTEAQLRLQELLK